LNFQIREDGSIFLQDISTGTSGLPRTALGKSLARMQGKPWISIPARREASRFATRINL
jgi:hypothetical protein